MKYCVFLTFNIIARNLVESGKPQDSGKLRGVYLREHSNFYNRLKSNLPKIDNILESQYAYEDDIYSYFDDLYPFDEAIEREIIASLLLEKPSKYSFSDKLPHAVSRLAMLEEGSSFSGIIWMAVGNPHRCFGGLIHHSKSYEMYFSDDTLSCKEVKHPPSELEGYVPLPNRFANDDFDSIANMFFIELFMFEPDRFTFMREYMLKFELMSWEPMDVDGNVNAEIKVLQPDGTCFSIFTCKIGWGVEWGDERPC